MSDKEHKLIGSLRQQLSDRVMDRREFVRYATLLRLSAPAAYMMAGKIAGEDFIPRAQAQDMPKGGVIKFAMRVPKVDNPHTFSWVYDSNIVRTVTVTLFGASIVADGARVIPEVGDAVTIRGERLEIVGPIEDDPAAATYTFAATVPGAGAR